MGYKLKTSKQTEDLLLLMERSENLPVFALVKLAISLSLRSGGLSDDDMSTDTRGREFNRHTVTGDFDCLYKCLMELSLNRHLNDDEFFPYYVKAHLDRGTALLEQERQYGSDFLVHLSELDRAI